MGLRKKLKKSFIGKAVRSVRNLFKGPKMPGAAAEEGGAAAAEPVERQVRRSAGEGVVEFRSKKFQ